MALLVILGQTLLAAAAGKQDSALSVRITSPLGRTGLPGTVRIVAQVRHGQRLRPRLAEPRESRLHRLVVRGQRRAVRPAELVLADRLRGSRRQHLPDHVEARLVPLRRGVAQQRLPEHPALEEVEVLLAPDDVAGELGERARFLDQTFATLSAEQLAGCIVWQSPMPGEPLEAQAQVQFLCLSEVLVPALNGLTVAAAAELCATRCLGLAIAPTCEAAGVKPTPAEMENGNPRKARAKTPPTIANGIPV